MRFFSFLFLFLLISCSKEKKIEKNINGVWKISLVKIDDSEGFSYIDTIPTGNLSFNSNNKNSLGKVNYSYKSLSGSVCNDSLKLEFANYIINSKKSRIYIIQNSDTIDCRILLLTPYDLQLEYYDLANYKLKRFVFQK